MQSVKRLSIRAVALRYGLPPSVVARAISSGELPAIVVTTDTGRERAYIAPEDAEHWVTERLSIGASTSPVGGSV